jgi:O-Antigen ligase
VSAITELRPIESQTGDNASTRQHAVLLLQIFAITLLVFPSDTIIKAIGAAGFVAALVAIFGFVAWLMSTFLGLHNPLDHRHPTRAALGILWLVTLISFALMHRTPQTGTTELAADRWIMQLAGMTGVALIAAECLGSLQDVKRVLRALVGAAAFCSVVAAFQFWTNFDPAHYLRMIPGFTVNVVNSDISWRDGVKRVTGTAIDPIELGVVAGMLLPLALYLLMYDKERRAWKRWVPVVCIGLAVPITVSRSAILSVAVACGLFVVLLPSARRVPFFAALPVVIAAIFAVGHGLVGTLGKYFTLGSSDPSIAHRTNNYNYVEQLVRQAPWFGNGGGTYLPSSLHILDNQYLTTTIELGLVGLAALTFYFVLPVATALVARSRTVDAEMRTLCGALAGAALAAAICSGTFDSLSFPMFAYVDALVLGLCGTCWLIVARSQDSGATRVSQLRSVVFD